MEATELDKFKSKLCCIFHATLQKKASWGKNEIYREFELALRDTEIDLLKEKLEK